VGTLLAVLDAALREVDGQENWNRYDADTVLFDFTCAGMKNSRMNASFPCVERDSNRLYHFLDQYSSTPW
jgi:hypothetical protein